jgi:drug/metabolite transporter (DMT)-like permease
MFSIGKKILNSASFNLSAAMIIVGSSVICGKTITQDFPLFLASELRFLIAAGLFLPLKIYRRELFHLPQHDWILLTIMAFCGQILFTILLLLGLRYTSGMNAGTLTSTTPFFMALFSFFILKEILGLQQIFGLLFAFSSIFLLGFDTFHSLTTANGQQWFGNLLVLTAVASEAVFLLLGKKLHTRISCQSTTALLCLLGAVFCLPPALFESMHFDFLSLTATDVVAMLYFGVVYTDIAYLLWFRGAARSSGATASAFTALMPLSASLLSAFFLNEHMSYWQTSALAAAVTSILLLTL